MEELYANERGGKGREAALQLAEAELQALCTFRPNLAKPRVQGLETPAMLSDKILRKGTTKSAEDARKDKLQRLQVGLNPKPRKPPEKPRGRSYGPSSSPRDDICFSFWHRLSFEAASHHHVHCYCKLQGRSDKQRVGLNLS